MCIIFDFFEERTILENGKTLKGDLNVTSDKK